MSSPRWQIFNIEMNTSTSRLQSNTFKCFKTAVASAYTVIFQIMHTYNNIDIQACQIVWMFGTTPPLLQAFVISHQLITQFL